MKPCKHTTTVPGCRICWLDDNDPRYRARWRGTPLPTSAANQSSIQARVPLCIHYADAPRVIVRDGSSRDWRQCQHSPSLGVVCPCKSCGPSCAGYTIDTANPVDTPPDDPSPDSSPDPSPDDPT